MGVSQNGWFINVYKRKSIYNWMMTMGTPILGNHHITSCSCCEWASHHGLHGLHMREVSTGVCARGQTTSWGWSLKCCGDLWGTDQGLGTRKTPEAFM